LVFAYGRKRRHVVVQSLATIIEDHGVAAALETDAVRTTAWAHMTRAGRERLRAVTVIRKGST
jgi:creatinine amidohydrolase/Fe(II)-dependent formamide hydrolase-like protein